MDYPKFEFTAHEKAEFLSVLTEIALFVEPKERIQLVEEDPTDNIFIECAVEAKTDFLITGDKHLINKKEFHDIKIVKAADFLQILKNSEAGEHLTR